MIIPPIVEQHAESAATLYLQRRRRAGSARLTLDDLTDVDERLAAHLDGIVVAGERAWPWCEAALESASASAIFVATVHAIEERRVDRLLRIVAVAGETPRARAAAAAAFGWVPRGKLNGIVVKLLQSSEPAERLAGLTACALHRVDPGRVLHRLIQDPDVRVRARVLRTIGELGLAGLAPLCATIADHDACCREWAAWSAVMLGDRGRALEALGRIALEPAGNAMRALKLTMQASRTATAHELLRALAHQREQTVRVIEGCAAAGDPAYVPWLLDQMGDEATASVAAEAFTVITGASAGDGGAEPLDQESGRRWWHDRSREFRAGDRYFMGAPVTDDHCARVLRTGTQQQRSLAAHYLCLLHPGAPLFNTCAPAWRQHGQLSAAA